MKWCRESGGHWYSIQTPRYFSGTIRKYEDHDKTSYEFSIKTAHCHESWRYINTKNQLASHHQMIFERIYAIRTKIVISSVCPFVRWIKVKMMSNPLEHHHRSYESIFITSTIHQSNNTFPLRSSHTSCIALRGLRRVPLPDLSLLHMLPLLLLLHPSSPAATDWRDAASDVARISVSGGWEKDDECWWLVIWK